MLAEMVRVTRPGGIVFVTFTNWLSPYGGHETSPWHYLGGDRAAARYQRKHGKPPKNRFGHSLHPVSVAEVLGWARSAQEAVVVDAVPRYLPGWTRPLVRVPAAAGVPDLEPAAGAAPRGLAAVGASAAARAGRRRGALARVASAAAGDSAVAALGGRYLGGSRFGRGRLRPWRRLPRPWRRLGGCEFRPGRPAAGAASALASAALASAAGASALRRPRPWPRRLRRWPRRPRPSAAARHRASAAASAWAALASGGLGLGRLGLSGLRPAAASARRFRPGRFRPAAASSASLTAASLTTGDSTVASRGSSSRPGTREAWVAEWRRPRIRRRPVRARRRLRAGLGVRSRPAGEHDADDQQEHAHDAGRPAAAAWRPGTSCCAGCYRAPPGRRRWLAWPPGWRRRAPGPWSRRCS